MLHTPLRGPTRLNFADFTSREKVMRAMSSIHGSILRKCNQVPWADYSEYSKASEDETENSKFPLSKAIMLHRILHTDVCWDRLPQAGTFIGPTTFTRFMHCFKYVFKVKSVEINEQVCKRRYLSNFFVLFIIIVKMEECDSRYTKSAQISTRIMSVSICVINRPNVHSWLSP